MKWRDTPSLSEGLWREAERKAFAGQRRIACPTGDGEWLRYFFRRHSGSRGGFWLWCPSCGSYSHASARVPDWWQEVSIPEDAPLAHDPAWLDEMWDDEWLRIQPLPRE